MVQEFELHTFTDKDLGSIPVWGTKIAQAPGHNVHMKCIVAKEPWKTVILPKMARIYP